METIESLYKSEVQSFTQVQNDWTALRDTKEAENRALHKKIEEVNYEAQAR